MRRAIHSRTNTPTYITYLGLSLCAIEVNRPVSHERRLHLHTNAIMTRHHVITVEPPGPALRSLGGQHPPDLRPPSPQAPNPKHGPGGRTFVSLCCQEGPQAGRGNAGPSLVWVKTRHYSSFPIPSNRAHDLATTPTHSHRPTPSLFPIPQIKSHTRNQTPSTPTPIPHQLPHTSYMYTYGHKSGVLLVYSWGQWANSSDRFVGHPETVESMVRVDEVCWPVHCVWW